jgi:hypothetical protein
VVTEEYCPQGGPGLEVLTGDDVLDPGEQWRYTCRHELEMAGAAAARATATAPDGSTVTAEAEAIFDTVSPFAIEVSTPVTRVTAGDSVTWRIAVQNVGDYPLVKVQAQVRVMYPGWVGPVDFAPAVGPETSGADDDEVLAPGEIWTWTYAEVVAVDGSYAEVWVSGAPQVSPLSGFRFVVLSDVLAVSPAPAPTRAPSLSPAGVPTGEPQQLPATGAAGMLGVSAVALVAMGGVMVRVRRSPRRCARF